MGVGFDFQEGKVLWASGGGLSIGDTIGGGNANRLLYLDGSANISDDGLEYMETIVGGIAPFYAMQPHEWGSSDVTFGFADLTGFGQNKVVLVNTQGGTGAFLISTGSAGILQANASSVDIGVMTNMPDMATSLKFGGTGNQPLLIDLAGADASFEYYMGRTEGANTLTGTDAYSFHVNSSKSFFWMSSSYNPLMQLEASNGALYLPSLDTDGTAPTPSGTTKMVITDDQGMLSFEDIPTGSPAGSDKEVQFNDSGAFGASSDFTYDTSNGRLTLQKYTQMYGDSILRINDYNGSELVTFSTPNPTFSTNFKVFGPGAAEGVLFSATAATTSTWSIGSGNDLFFIFGVANSIVTLAMNDVGKVQLGDYAFNGIDGWVQAYGHDASVPTFVVRNAASQSVDSTQWINSSRTVMASVTKEGGANFTAQYQKVITTTSTSYTVLATDYTILGDASGAAITVNLPAATGSGRILNIKKVDSSINAVTADGNSGDTIDGSTTKALALQYNSMQIQDTAANAWSIL